MPVENLTTPKRLTRQTAAAPVSIVHLGPGAFFRAFNAVFTHEVMAKCGGSWGILAVSLKSPTARDQLCPQGGVYHAVSLAPEGPSYTLIDSISDVLVAPENPDAVVEAMSDPSVKIVSLTVTEKGYCHEPSTGRLRLRDAGIQADLANPSAPSTAPGFIVEALARRKERGHRPFTVLSCDNLPDNGQVARGIVLEFAKARDPHLAEWIAQESRFPSTMVDRITPATTEDDLARVKRETGYEDLGCVLHEPFRQWVIEDDFVDGLRPDWDAVGAQFVRNVSAHEAMKLRCLNGTHSALAYLGYLAGHETISETVADAPFAALCQKLWSEEIVPTLEPPEGEDLGAYCEALLARYRNPAIRHRTWQIAMDGSQKLPQRLLGTVADNLAAGRDISGLSLAVAAWMRYIGGIDEMGQPIDVRDPQAAVLKSASEDAETPSGRVSSLLAIEDVFGLQLARNAEFSEPVRSAFERLIENGARASVMEYVNA